MGVVMSTTRAAIDRIQDNLQESLGVRSRETRPPLSPAPQSRDQGRSPLRDVGRIDIDLVIPDPDQPRSEFSDEALTRLAQSIRDKGQLSPLRVRWNPELNRWVIISGERRWRASQRAGLKTVECYFHEQALSRSEILEQQLIENLLREDLRPIEEARAFALLLEINGWTGKQLAEALRVAPSQVTRSLALLRLPDDIQEEVQAGTVSTRSAYEISKLPDRDQQRELARQAAAKTLTHEHAANAVRRHSGKPRQAPRGTRQAIVTPEGWKVTVSSKRKGNYFEVEQALTYALEEVRLRINNNAQLF